MGKTACSLWPTLGLDPMACGLAANGHIYSARYNLDARVRISASCDNYTLMKFVKLICKYGY